MKRKAISGLMLALLVTSMLTLAFNIQPVKAATEIIIDTHGDNRFTRYPAGPYWWSVSDHDVFRTRAYNNNFWYTYCGAEGQDELYFGTWQASLPQSGVYQVSVWIPKPDAFGTYTPTRSAIYQIYYSGGMAVRTISQRVSTGGWYSLGSYTFGSSASVILNDRTGEPYLSTMLAFDAVKFTAAPTPRTLTVSSAHGSPNPSIGEHTYSNGSSVTCSVSSRVVEGGVSYSCIGWSGTGSVPSSGNGTSVTFKITQASSITWNWRASAIFYVKPRDYLYTAPASGTEFTADVRIANASDVAGWQVELSYNKNYLWTDGGWYSYKVGYAADMIFPAGSYSPVGPSIQIFNATHNFVMMTATTNGAVEYSTPLWPEDKGLMSVKFTIIKDPDPGQSLSSLLHIAISPEAAFGSWTIDNDLYENDLTTYDGCFQNAYIVPHKFQVGDRVRTTANLNVREGAGIGYSIIDTMPEGTLGQIMGGPVEADGYAWWDVNYDVGIRGWSAQNWLELGPPNQPPVADFAFYPQQPKAGEDVTFNASSSYDSDGEVVFYEWDWDGDGVFDDYTKSPTITFWWVEDGTYDVRLGVIDDKGAVNVTDKEVTVSKTTFWWSEEETSKASVAAVDTASLSWWGIYKSISKDDKKAITQIDTWIRDGKGKPLDWFKPYREADLARLLNEEVDPVKSPGLTYKVFARSKILEGDLIAEVSVYFQDRWYEVREGVMKPLFEQVFNSVWQGIPIKITVDVVKMLFPIVGFGLQSILFAKSVYGLQKIVNALNKKSFMWGLAWYLFWRAANPNPAVAWSMCLDSVEQAISTKEVPIAEGKEREDMLVEIQSYYDRLWGEYQERLQHIGSWKSYLQADKGQLKNLLLSEFRKRFLAEGPDRRIVDVGSPVELRVYDSVGLITGVANGEMKVEIPYSVYNSETETATIFSPSESLKYEVAGTGAGTYGLEVTSIENGQIINFTATNIPTSTTAIHHYTIDWAALSRGEKGVTLQTDSNGDGTFEHTFTADNELTHLPGDVNSDSKVDGKDIAFAAKAFASYPGHPRWKPIADENEDNKIDGKDLALIAKKFGTTYI